MRDRYSANPIQSLFNRCLKVMKGEKKPASITQRYVINFRTWGLPNIIIINYIIWIYNFPRRNHPSKENCPLTRGLKRWKLEASCRKDTLNNSDMSKSWYQVDMIIPFTKYFSAEYRWSGIVLRCEKQAKRALC